MGSVSSPKPPHVLIVGAGVGGLFLAQCLRKHNISFEVFERDVGVSSSGTGNPVGLPHPDDIQELLPEDLLPIRAASNLLPLPLVSQMMYYINGGKKIVGVEDSARTPCTRASRLRLRQLLSEGIDVRWGKTVVTVREDAEKGAALRFEDGTTATGDVVVGADGTFSAVREHLLDTPNDDILEPVPEAAVRGRVTLSGAEMEHQLNLGHSAYVVFGEGFRLGVGLGGVAEDGNSADFYWSICVPDQDVDGGDAHWMRKAPKDKVYRYCLDKVEGLEPKFREIVKRTGAKDVEGGVISWTGRLPEMPNIGRVVLLGDAAHPVAPFRGEEGILTIGDATTLAGVLADADANDVEALAEVLDEWQQKCVERASRVVEVSLKAMDDPKEDGENPMCWGYMTGLMKQRPVGPSLRFRLEL